MSEDEEMREAIARWGFYIWKDAKSTETDNWDDVTWESLPEKHKAEYLVGADRLLGQGLAVLAKDQSSPLPHYAGTTLGASWKNKENDMLHRFYVESNFRRIVEKPPDYLQAEGVLPWTTEDELPEETLRRLYREKQ